MKIRALLVLLLLSSGRVSAEHAIYNSKGRQVNIGDGSVTEVLTRGFLLFQPDTKRATAVVGFTINGLKFFGVVPLQNYRFDTVSGPGGATYSIMSKAESPGTQFAGTLLESVYSRGKNVAVKLGPGATQSLPKVFTGAANVILTSPVNGATITGQSHSRLTLDLQASVASNIAAESFDAVVTRLTTLFVARGFVQLNPESAQ